MTIPIATARALRLVGAHPAVGAIRILQHLDDGAVIAEIDIVNELPAAWRMAGESPSGVRNAETITLSFPATYPAFAPQFALRMDFNRSHPHINSGPANLPPHPCLVAGSPTELIQSRGIEALVDQLVDWLDKAALLKLNDPATGWEPVRRDNVDDFMVVDGAKLRAFANSAGGCVAVSTTFFQLVETNLQLFLVDHRSCDLIELKNAQCCRRQVNKIAWRGASVGLIAWAPDASPEQPFVADQYLPETVSTVRDLLDRAKRYGCRSQFEPRAKSEHGDSIKWR
jgi:hypothetical protein